VTVQAAILLQNRELAEKDTPTLNNNSLSDIRMT
jgi:hypothetical protein